MIIISAMSENRVIGRGNRMPWDVPAEYEQYLRFVSGQTVVMGRKTYEVFGIDLSTDTTAIVVSRRPSSGIGIERRASVANSLEDAIAMANRTGNEVFIAGGGSIYEQAIPLVDEMYLSTIKGTFDGDTYFPDFDAEPWNLVEERDEPEYIFRKLRRRVSVEQRLG